MKKLIILLLLLFINLFGNAEALTLQNSKTQFNQESYVSKLPDCKSSSTHKHNCIGTLTFASGNKYVGEFKNNKRHGQGTYIYAGGAIESGIWENGKLLDVDVSKLPDCKSSSTYRHNCFGTYTHADGDKYVGEFKDNKGHGQGAYNYVNGDKFVGEYKDGKRHGQGAYTFASGNKFVGEWKNGKRHGQGAYTFASGDKYVGEWKNGKRHGQGTYTYASGSKYVGEFKNNEYNGQGTFTFASGNKYAGEFKSDKRHGQGTYTYVDGAKYVGEFKSDKYNGQGAYTYASGNKYVGEFKNNEYNGQGTYIFTSGNKYVGEFKSDKYNGQGTFTFAGGAIESGIWENGKLLDVDVSKLPDCKSSSTYKHNCIGTYTYVDGDKYVGEFKNNKRHGQGTYTFASGSKYVGEFKNSNYNGQGTYTYADGDKYFGEYKNGKKHGQGIFTFGHSSEWAGDKYVGEYKDGKRHGQGAYTFSDGTIKKGIWESGELLHANNKEVYSTSSGSGFAVTSNGYVVTNYHVVKGCTDVKIHDKGRKIKASIVTYDPNNDIALLKGNFIPRKFYPLSRKSPELLTEVFVAGHPFGKRISASVKVTKGIVSSLSGVGNNFSNFQIDAALQPGNSGGPIMNDKGNVVGVAVAKLKRDWAIKEFDTVPELVNFGVKSSVVIGILESENINLIAPYKEAKSYAELGSMITDGTYYLSCWMTEAQIKKVEKTKVVFQ